MRCATCIRMEIGHRSKLTGARFIGGSVARFAPSTAAVVLLLAMGCSQSSDRPNILLVSIDTLRADHLGSYGYSRETSPALDELAKRSVRFTRAYSPASWTLPAHMSLMTSRYPSQHGVQSERMKLSSSIPMLAELLFGSGYETAGFISWYYVGKRFGFDRGFDTFTEFLIEGREPGGEPRAKRVIDAALEWLESSRTEQPFFLFVHLFDPHLDYAPPGEYATRFANEATPLEAGTYDRLRPYIRGLHRNPAEIPHTELQGAMALYDGEIRYTDEQIGRLLSAIEESDLAASTVVVVTSDHGEEMNDHGSMEGHQWTLYEEVTRIPLIIHVPGEPGGRTVEALVDILDVAPSLLSLAGLDAPSDMRGRSLLPWLVGEAPDTWDRHLFSQIKRFNHKRAVRSGRYKLIETIAPRGVNRFGVPISVGYELYDLERDPRERTNIYDRQPEEAAALRNELEGFHSESDRPDAPPSAVTMPLGEEDRRRLESIGYVE